MQIWTVIKEKRIKHSQKILSTRYHSLLRQKGSKNVKKKKIQNTSTQ